MKNLTRQEILESPEGTVLYYRFPQIDTQGYCVLGSKEKGHIHIWKIYGEIPYLYAAKQDYPISGRLMDYFYEPEDKKGVERYKKIFDFVKELKTRNI